MKNDMTSTKKIKLILLIYCICFFTVWTVFELCIKSSIGYQFVKSGIIKTGIWVLPSILLIHKYQDTMKIGLKEMFITKVKWWRYLWVYTILIIWVLLGGFRRGFSFSLDPNELIIVLFVGITEEMAFRGWLLNATIKDMPQWAAIFINALLFLAIHFPRWIQEGVFISVFTSLEFLGLIILSMVFSISFLKSKNLLIPITMHMLYDLMTFMLLP